MRDTIEMAREAGIEEAYSLQHDQVLVQFKNGSLERLVALARADERAEHEADKTIIEYHEATIERLNKALAAQKPWVGLTDEEIEDIELGCRSTPFGKIEAMQKVEAKLKEKNT